MGCGLERNVITSYVGYRIWRLIPGPVPVPSPVLQEVVPKRSLLQGTGGIHQSHLTWMMDGIGLSLSPNTSPTKQHGMGTPKQDGLGTDHLVVSVTRSPPGTTDLSPFKIITKVRERLN